MIVGALCCISVDIDAVAGWLGSYGGEDSTSDISRGSSGIHFYQKLIWLTSLAGLFAGTIGVRRLLKLFAKYNIKTTWYIPGHSLETFPEECAMIRDAGHEMYSLLWSSSHVEVLSDGLLAVFMAIRMRTR